MKTANGSVRQCSAPSNRRSSTARNLPPPDGAARPGAQAAEDPRRGGPHERAEGGSSDAGRGHGLRALVVQRQAGKAFEAPKGGLRWRGRGPRSVRACVLLDPQVLKT